jgi:predicted sugar kinase
VLARLVSRGARSGIGVFGFESGGFLMTFGGLPATGEPPPLLRREFPNSWRVVFFIAPGERGLHGEAEHEAFEQLGKDDPKSSIIAELEERMAAMFSAVGVANFSHFSDAVYEFNAQVGSMFAGVQGCSYAHPLTTEIIGFLRRQGVRGVGQTSWGPAGFAIMKDEESGRELVMTLRERFNLDESAVFLTSAANHGARVEPG